MSLEDFSRVESFKLVSRARIFLRKDLREKYAKKLTYKNYARDLTNHCVHMYIRDLTMTNDFGLGLLTLTGM